jgi:hypothetical protein
MLYLISAIKQTQFSTTSAAFPAAFRFTPVVVRDLGFIVILVM